MMGYERFAAWQLCHELTLMVYRVTDNWPVREKYALVSQTRRAAASAPTNIAEGAAKRGRREFRRYLDIANGSLAELAYLIRLARDLGIMPEAEWMSVEELRARTARATWLLYKSMEPKPEAQPPR